MAQVFEAFTQPVQSSLVNVKIVGDPVFGQDDSLMILNYGNYRVKEVYSTSGLIREYQFQRTGVYSPAIATVPRGTLITAERDGVTHSVLPYNPVIALNFKEDDYRTLTLAGNISFNTQNHCDGKSIVVRIKNKQSTSLLSFPPSWIFMGSSGRPTSIAAGKTGVLSVTCFGTSDADIIAVWIAQA